MRAFVFFCVPLVNQPACRPAAATATLLAFHCFDFFTYFPSCGALKLCKYARTIEWVNLKHWDVLDGTFSIVRKFLKTRAFKCVVNVSSSRSPGNTACKTSTVKVSPITAATLREGENRRKVTGVANRGEICIAERHFFFGGGVMVLTGWRRAGVELGDFSRFLRLYVAQSIRYRVSQPPPIGYRF